MLGTDLAPGTAVQMPTWSEENGQDDLYWYNAAADENGNIRLELNFSLHSAASPVFITHLYHDGEFLGGLSYAADGVKVFPYPESQLNRYCQTVFDEVGYDLHDVYLWTVRNISYTVVPWHDAPRGYTRQQWYALEGFTNRRGDCHTFSSAFAELACRLGYDARYVVGWVWSVRNCWVTHSFVIVHYNGQDYVCDPELESVAKKPKDLFMQPSTRTKAKYKW